MVTTRGLQASGFRLRARGARAAPLAIALAIALLAACAGPRPAEVTYPPDELTATELDRELARKNDAELWAIGEAAESAGELGRAAAAFGRIVDLHPGSAHAPEAALRAGRALERTGAFAEALRRFRAGVAAGGPPALEAAFGEAECLYHLGDLPGARAALAAVEARPGLSAADRVRALAQRGVVELESGLHADAERTLVGALDAASAASERERVPAYWRAQAEFHLGELRREAFRAVKLDPSSGDDEALARDLERKAGLLLAAQERYLATMRTGDARWAVAAGLRVGELYEELRAELLAAPPPPGLDAAAEALYRSELEARVKVLARKAIQAWEETLAIAARSGERDLRAVPEAEEALERLKAVAAQE
jgi:hypothetical protein